MTELFEPTDAHDRRLALGAPTGLLHTFNEAGVLTAADVHVAVRLGELGQETDETVLLAVALATRAVQNGSVCLDLATVPAIAPDLSWPESVAWAAAVAASPLVAAGVMRCEFDLVYLDRYHQQEVQVALDLLERSAQPSPQVDEALLEVGVLRVFPNDSYDEQRAASRRAAGQWTTVLTGGPGTGKTSAVAGLIALLAEQVPLHGSPPRVALSAPTGKAAARLQQAVHEAALELPEVDRDRLHAALGSGRAMTLHSLLGTRRENATRFRHHRGNRLPHDIVVVDEASMVSLTLMARLVEAVRSDARLVMVGDPDQLASVEAGAVLADLVQGLTLASPSSSGPVVTLSTAHRFGPEILTLASALRIGDADEVMSLLRAGGGTVEFIETEHPAEALREILLPAGVALHDAAASGDAAVALAALDRHRFLCAHREGPYGVRTWNRRVEQWLAEEIGLSLWQPMYVGRPLLVTANDHGLQVYNGDVGLVIDTPRGPRALLASASGPKDLPTSRVGDVETMHAMTIHKAQGSQANEVTVLLPGDDSRLLTLELFYTAVTRAQDKVRIVGTEAGVRAAVGRRVQRASGLQFRLARG